MGEVTKITHLLGRSPSVYPTGDQRFDIGTVGQFAKGWPMMVHDVDKNTYQRVLGKPGRLSEDAYQAWFALHVSENTIGHYVRVIADDAKYQYLSLYSDWLVDETATEWAVGITYTTGDITHKANIFYISQTDDNTGNDPATDEGTNWVPYIEAGSATFDTDVNPAGNVMLIAILKNGITEENKYGISITNKNATKLTFDVNVYEKQADGSSKLIETRTVSLNEDALDGMGRSLFIENVFAINSDDVAFKCIATPDFTKILEHEEIVWFTGGDAGSAPDSDNYSDAWDLLKDTAIDLDLVFTAGDTTTVNIGYAAAVADERDCRLEADIPAGNTADTAKTWVEGLSLQSHNYCFTFGQISFNDPFYPGNRKYMRMSGLAVAAKAWSREKSRNIVHPGVEEAPAGEEYGLLRGVTGVRNETPLTEADKETLAGAWINYIVSSSNNGLIFWEQYTLYGEESPYAYKSIVDVINYVYKVHKSIARQFQFRKKTDREIIDLLSPVLQHFKTKGVLIAADDTATEYPEAYKIWITTVGSKRQIHRSMRFARDIGPVILETIPI